MSLKRPHETLGIPVPVGRRITSLGKNSWLVAIGCAIALSAGMYMYQINAAAKQGFTLRILQKTEGHLRDQVAELEDLSAKSQTIHTLKERVQTLGYVEAHDVVYVDANGNTVAMK